jgi:putative aldouronate transport system substrate-binding protein
MIEVGAFLPPNYDSGSRALTWQGNPAFSDTAFKKAGEAHIRQLLKLCDWLTDARHAIMRGQQPVSSWDDTLKDWRSSGGDKIRQEFEDLLQKNG